MFVIRLGVIALVVLALLPGPPRADVGGRAGGDARGGFCHHYPKTCEAAVEISAALKHKLAYGAGWLRRQGDALAGGRHGLRQSRAAETGEVSRRGEWPRLPAPLNPGWRVDSGSLTSEDRLPVWQGAPPVRGAYPGRR